MNDKQILDLYWARSEDAISETSKRYGRYCHYIAKIKIGENAHFMSEFGIKSLTMYILLYILKL